MPDAGRKRETEDACVRVARLCDGGEGGGGGGVGRGTSGTTRERVHAIEREREREREGESESGRERVRLLKRAAVLSAPIDYGAGKVEAHRAKTLREKNYPMEPIRHPRELSSARVRASTYARKSVIFG